VAGVSFNILEHLVRVFPDIPALRTAVTVKSNWGVVERFAHLRLELLGLVHGSFPFFAVAKNQF
jgi:hypothetical protein